MHISQGPRSRGWPVAARIRVAVVVALAFIVVACSGDVVLEPTEAPVIEPRPIAETMLPKGRAVVVDEAEASSAALEASKTFFSSAQVVVLATGDDPHAMTRAASVAVTLGTPLLLTDPPTEVEEEEEPAQNFSEGGSGNLNTELLRLGTRAVLTVGRVNLQQLDTTSLVVQPIPDDIEEVQELLGSDFQEVPAPSFPGSTADLKALEPGQLYAFEDSEETPEAYGTYPETLPAVRGSRMIVLADDDDELYPAVATAKAAGAEVFIGDEPASDPTVLDFIADHPSQPVVRIGGEQDAKDLRRTVASMREGRVLPNGSQRVYTSKQEPVRLVTLKASTALTQDGVDDADAVFNQAYDRSLRVEKKTGERTVGGVEIDPTEITQEDLIYWVSRAEKHNQYLVLEVEVGSGTVETLREYEELLTKPFIGINLVNDGPTVDSGQVNDAVVYLRELAREHKLPQKLAIVSLDGARLSTPESLTEATWEVALTIMVNDGAGEDWDTMRDTLTGDVYWGVGVAGSLRKDESTSSALSYPRLKEIMGLDEANLTAYQ